MTSEPNEAVDPAYGVKFLIFVALFWPVSMVVGLIDHWVILDYDLRLATLALSALVGWVGTRVFEARRRREAEAEAPEPLDENPGWAAVRSRPRGA